MSPEQSNDPLHGVTLKAMLEELVARHGWPALAERVRIRCFDTDPSIASSLKFLRRTAWARHEVEQLYLADPRRSGRSHHRADRRGSAAWRRERPR